MEMRHRGGAGKIAVADVPGDFTRGRVVSQIGRSFAGGLNRGNLLGARKRHAERHRRCGRQPYPQDARKSRLPQEGLAATLNLSCSPPFLLHAGRRNPRFHRRKARQPAPARSCDRFQCTGKPLSSHACRTAPTYQAGANASARMRSIIARTPLERWGVRCCSRPNSRNVARASVARISLGVRSE